MRYKYYCTYCNDESHPFCDVTCASLVSRLSVDPVTFSAAGEGLFRSRDHRNGRIKHWPGYDAGLCDFWVEASSKTWNPHSTFLICGAEYLLPLSSSVPPPRGLCWPEQCSKLPQIKIWNNVNHRRFVNFHAMSTPPAQTKSPPCWRLSGDGSGPHYQPAAASSIPSLFRRFYHDLLQTS